MYSASGADYVKEYDVGNAYHIVIIIKLKHKYVVLENMKLIQIGEKNILQIMT